MNKVYTVHRYDIDLDFIEKTFSNKTKAQAYIDEKMFWKQQLKEETGLDYDKWYNEDWLFEHKSMSHKMQNWLDDHHINDNITYYISALEVE